MAPNINLIKVLFILLISALFVACGPPEEFNKGVEEMSLRNYRKAMLEFDRIDPKDEEWVDSAMTLRLDCFKGLVDGDEWSEFRKACDQYDYLKPLISEARNYAVGSILEQGTDESMKPVFDLLDAKDNGIPDDIREEVANRYITGIIAGYYWDGSGNLSGQQVYFDWTEPKKEGEKARLHGYSNRNNSGWTVGMLMYSSISYHKNGRYKLTPRTFQGGRSGFSNNWGALYVYSPEKIQIYYGSISKSNFFFRGTSRDVDYM